MQKRFNLQPGAIADLPRMQQTFEASVRQMCNRDYTEAQLDAWIGRATPSRWEELLTGDLQFLLAEEEVTKALAGFTSINTQGYLHSMFVHPDYQRQGVATLLLNAAEAFARKHDAPSVHSEVSLTAQPFFTAKGYHIIKEQTVNIHPESLQNAVMEKQL
ncbi:MAG TPA: GNAT family N-acetyltransferase [Bacteroides reticulotermitis]|nr:GNAT family N-acetyltransferase [Bacteroides reticulotermitis]